MENLVGISSGGQTLNGNVLNNEITAGAGNDVLNGGFGADIMAGGAGNDIYYVDASGDNVIEVEGAGIDGIISHITYILVGSHVENLTLAGSGNINGTGNNLDNLLTGNAGNNSLIGGVGNDRLSGAAGMDRLIGGAGQDMFVFDTALGAGNVDVITDFNVTDDVISLASSIFSAAGAAGQLAAGAFCLGAVALDASDRIMYDNATGNLYYDANGNAAGGSVLFAQLAAGLALTNADFVIG